MNLLLYDVNGDGFMDDQDDLNADGIVDDIDWLYQKAIESGMLIEDINVDELLGNTEEVAE